MGGGSNSVIILSMIADEHPSLSAIESGQPLSQGKTEQTVLHVEITFLNLQGEQKERFNAIQQELSQLSSKFSNNVLDSTKAYKKLVTDKGTLDGVPESALALFAQGAKNDGHPDATAEEGPWLLTLVSMRLLPIKIKKKSEAYP